MAYQTHKTFVGVQLESYVNQYLDGNAYRRVCNVLIKSKRRDSEVLRLQHQCSDKAAELAHMANLTFDAGQNNVLHTYQGNDLVGVLVIRHTTPIELLRIFPIAKRGNNVFDATDVTDSVRIAAFQARVAMTQPKEFEMDELLKELMDGADAANWTDVPVKEAKDTSA